MPDSGADFAADSRADSGRHVLLLPGGGYGTQGPLLMYAGVAAERRGADLGALTWHGRPTDLGPLGQVAWVCAQVERALDGLPGSSPDAAPLLIGKSLGTLAATVAADRELPAIWLTPLLTDGTVVTALRRSTAPRLLIGGTADPLWDGDLARELSPYVLQIDGADHGMFVAGRLANSADVLAKVVSVVEEFLDDVIWPTRTH